MSRILRPDEIAVIVEGNLNDLALALYTSGDVMNKIKFEVTADFQIYERLQKGEFTLNDNQKITPVVIERKDFIPYEGDYLRYEEFYEMQVYGYSAEQHALETILKQYTAEENTTDQSVAIGDFRVTKSMQDISFGEVLEPKDGTLDKRVAGNGNFRWNFLDGIMTSYDIAISIDGIEIPYVQYGFVDSNRTIASETIDSTGKTGLKSTGFYGIQMTIPYISTSPKIVEIYNDFYNGKYNKSYILSYLDSAGVSYSYEVVVQAKSLIDSQPSILDYTVTFVRKELVATITIDGVVVPVLSFNLGPGAEVSATQNINDDRIKQAYIGSRYEIKMELDISDATNSTVQGLFQKVLDVNFEIPYIIELTKGAVTGSYNVILISGTYNFVTNPDNSIYLTFVESDGQV